MKRPELNPAACMGKERFESPALAHSVAKRSHRNLHTKTVRNRDVYRCNTCGGWHLGGYSR